MWFVAWHYVPSNGRQFRGRDAPLMLARALSQSTLFHSADYGFASSVYGLLPFCKQIVLLTNQVRLLPYIRLLSGILCCIPSHDEYPLTRP